MAFPSDCSHGSYCQKRFMSLWLTKKERASPLIILKVTMISDSFLNDRIVIFHFLNQVLQAIFLL